MFKNIFFVLLSSMLVLSACGNGNSPIEGKTSDEIVQEAMINLSEVESGNFEILVDGSAEAPEAGAVSKMGINLSAIGAYDMRDDENAVFEVSMGLTMAPEGQEEGTVSGELKMGNDNMYFSLTGVEGFGAEIPTELLEEALNKWWFIPMGEDANGFADLSALLANSSNEEVRELYKQFSLFKNAEYVGEEEFDGREVYKFETELDVRALQKFLKKSAELQGQEISEGEAELMKDFWKDFEFAGSVLVDKEEMMVRQFDGTMLLESPAEDSKVELRIVESFSNVNGEVEVSFPEEAELFDLMALLMGADLSDEDRTILYSQDD